VIIVTGYARTGTTLMQGLLCASADVMPVSAETITLRDVVLTYARSKEQWLDYSRHYFADGKAMLDFHRSMAGMWLAYVRKQFAGEKRLLQKLPQMAANYLHDAARLLPNARFVVMLRDPRDAIISQSERRRSSRQRFDAAKEINDFVRLYEKVMHGEGLAGRVALVAYETLVQDPIATIEALARFLGVAPPPDIASLEWQYIRVPETSTWSPLDGRPVSTERLTRHKSAPVPDIIALVEEARPDIERRIGPVFVDGRGPAMPIKFL
jgi:hypothetical protein